MPEFAYNNAMNASTSHTLFELNCGYYFEVIFKKDIDPCSRSRSANKQAEKLTKLMRICCQNLLHA